MAEKRKYATYEIEEQLLQEGCDIVVGVDEVGRGPGAGPVTAGAVWIPRDALPKLMVKVKDSKVLTEKRREELYELIDETCVWTVASVDNTVIDQINILEATKLAMFKALGQLEYKGVYIDHALIDGTVKIDDLWCPQTQIIRGDSKSISIAAASIMAKVTRDEEMRTLHWVYPEYGWMRNKGYLTREHIEAIQTYGITDYHRKSFRKVGHNG
jgi:ribonuclease HII